MDRKKFIKTSSIIGAGIALLKPENMLARTISDNYRAQPTALAITMWEFSWLERRWPGAGYENWDQALSELKERGYNAIRIDAFPHLIYKNPQAEYLLNHHWNNQVWGSPAVNKVRVQPYFIDFLTKCKEYGFKVGLSTWWREDQDESYLVINSPVKLGEVWLSVLNLIKKHNLLDQILYVDLSNEWPIEVWTPFKKDLGGWESEESIHWMNESINVLRREYPEIPYTFSIIGEYTNETLNKGDLSMLDFLEPHIWMTQAYDGEFYKKVGYTFERYTDVGYTNMALKAEKLYRENENYWKEGIIKQIEIVAQLSEKYNLPLITTECWGVVDYKDWPLLNWDWVMDMCRLGVETALKTNRWVGIATSNFCGPQFVGMWREKDWHKNLTDQIRSQKINPDFEKSKLIKRF